MKNRLPPGPTRPPRSEDGGRCISMTGLRASSPQQVPLECRHSDVARRARRAPDKRWAAAFHHHHPLTPHPPLSFLGFFFSPFPSSTYLNRRNSIGNHRGGSGNQRSGSSRLSRAAVFPISFPARSGQTALTNTIAHRTESHRI